MSDNLPAGVTPEDLDPPVHCDQCGKVYLPREDDEGLCSRCAGVDSGD